MAASQRRVFLLLDRSSRIPDELNPIQFFTLGSGLLVRAANRLIPRNWEILDYQHFSFLEIISAGGPNESG